MVQLVVRFAREPGYRRRVLHLLATVTAPPATEDSVTTDHPWMQGKRVYFIGGCEFTHIQEILRSLGAECYHTFDHHRPTDPSLELLDAESPLNEFGADVVILSVMGQSSAWIHGAQWRAFDLDATNQEADLDLIAEGLRQGLAALRAHSDVPVFLLTHPSAYRPFYGALEHRVLGERMALAEMTRRLDLALYDVARSNPNCYVLDTALLIDPIGTSIALTAESELLGEHLTPAGARVVADGLVRSLHALDPRSPKVKCVVVDLDDTLWTGVLREDGPGGVMLRRHYLRALKILAGRGILLAVCSKNDPEEIRHLAPLVGEGLFQSFAAIELGWGPKSDGLRHIAAQLNIGLDTLAFFDDNPRERAEVTMNAPEVLVFRDSDLIAALDLGPFQPGPTLTREALNRASSHRADAARTRDGVATEHRTPEEFLASLELRLDLRCGGQGDVPRVAELLARTNQLNATSQRTDSRQLRAGLNDGTIELVVASLEDRFGDYGLIGAAITQWAADHGEIIELAFSCRAMGKHVEHAVVAHLRTVAAQRGATHLRLQFRATERNGELRRILGEAGFAPGRSEMDMEMLTIAADSCASFPPWLSVSRS